MGTSLKGTPKNVGDRLSLAGPLRGGPDGGGRRIAQREHLVERPLVSNQVGLAQLRTSPWEFLGLEVQATANGRVGVIAQTFGIADGDQQQIQGQSGAIASAEVILADQTVVHPTEAGRHLTSPVRTEEV